jgi:hypothetical protein
MSNFLFKSDLFLLPIVILIFYFFGLNYGLLFLLGFLIGRILYVIIIQLYKVLCKHL